MQPLQVQESTLGPGWYHAEDRILLPHVPAASFSHPRVVHASSSYDDLCVPSFVSHPLRSLCVLLVNMSNDATSCWMVSLTTAQASKILRY